MKKINQKVLMRLGDILMPKLVWLKVGRAVSLRRVAEDEDDVGQERTGRRGRKQQNLRTATPMGRTTRSSRCSLRNRRKRSWLLNHRQTRVHAAISVGAISAISAGIVDSHGASDINRRLRIC